MANTSSTITTTAATSSVELDTYAQWAWLSGRIGEAVDLYQDLARAYKRFPHVHFKLGFLFLTLQDYGNAARHFSIEIERLSAQSEGDELSPSKSPSKRGAVLEKTFHFCACLGRSEAYAALKDDTKADNDLLFVANRGGSTRRVLVAMGELFSRFGMHLRAEGCLDKCAAADAEDPDYLVAHAELRLAQKRYANAARMFEKCRATCSASSATYHRALIGEGAALLRQNKLQEAVILLLQAMNNLRSCIRNVRESAAGSKDGELPEYFQLYHQATNLYAGLCLLKGELKAALDTYYSVIQSNKAADGEQFQLPPLCVLPGTRDAQGDLVDSTKLSTRNLGEVVRHLDEIELRYGPDPCVYFHRANAHKALGELELFVHDLSLVESLSPEFLTAYIRKDHYGDFLDLETIAWLPLQFVDAIHASLERHEHALPAAWSSVEPAAPRGHNASKSPTSRGSGSGRHAKEKATLKQTPLVSETAIFLYFEKRIQCGVAMDEYAYVHQLDAFRRLPAARRKSNAAHLAAQHLAPWEGVVFDETAPRSSSPGEASDPVRARIKRVVDTFGQNPCVHMVAGIVELQLFNASVASIYFTEALTLIAKSSDAAGSSGSQSALARRWQQRVADRVRFYCLVWRSVASRIKIEMERAVEDLNAAAAIQLDEHAPGSVDDPLLLVQRTLIMLLNGHLKAAFKLLRQLSHDVRRTLRQRRTTAAVSEQSEWTLVIDMFGNAGLNSFSLLPLRLETEFARLAHPASDGSDSSDAADGDAAQREDEEAAATIVRLALSKKAAAGGRTAGNSGVLQTETLDKLFESGLVKLAASGSLAQATPLLQAILSLDENYLPPTNFASLELLKCKEAECMEEKLFACFVRLGKRSKWLQRKARWPFEAFIDASLAHAYLPTDLDTLWHRARLLQDQANFVAAIADLSGCLELLGPHLSWEKSAKTPGSVKAVFATEAKRTQWLQLLLERGRLEMARENWERAIADLTVVIEQVGRSSPVIEASAYEARSVALIELRRLGHAIQDLQHLLRLKAAARTAANDGREDEDALLTHLLVGNLYCHLALEQLKASANVSRTTTALSVLEPALQATHVTGGFVAKADAHYAQALTVAPDHFLVHYFRGRMLALAAQAKRATESLGACLRRHPMFLPALFLRGCLYAQQRLPVLALADLYRVRHRAPTYPRLHTSIGLCHFDAGNMAKAVEALTEAVQLDPRDVDALYIRGCALQELFALESAAKDFARVLAVDAAHVRALYQRSVCLVLFRRYREALADLERALQLQSDWKDAWNLHAYASFCHGRFDDAVLSYGRAIGSHDAGSTPLEPRRPTPGQRDSQLFLHRALANMCAEHFSAALLDLDLALKRDADNVLGFVAKAFVLVKVGERDKAVPLLLHALPRYKTLALMSPCDVIDAERTKALAKEHSRAERSASFVANGFGFAPGTGSTAPGRANQASRSEPTHPAISASPSVIFADRKLAREEQEQRAQAYRQGRPEAETLAHQQLKPPGAAALSSRRRTLVGASLAAASMDALVDPNSSETLRRARKAKFLRAIKKLSFEHRVLKALESATSAKYKKNAQMSRVLADLVRTKSAVSWPRGTLTTNVLVWAFNTVGVHHVRQRRVEEALMAFSLAIQAHPLNAATLFNRANVFLHMEVLHSAVSGFQDAIEADESCYQAHNNAGVALFQLQRLEDAHDAFATGLHHVEGRKHKAILLYNLGVLLQSMDKPDEAMEFYQQAIALDGSRTEFFNNRSAILHQQLKFTVALEDYNRALALGSEGDYGASRSCIEARLNRAQLFITMGSCTSAIADLRVVLSALVSAREAEAKRSGSAVSICSETPQKTSKTAADDETLAEELLAFCAKWKHAIRIAVKDALFGLDAFPLFAQFDLYAFFGPQLSAPTSTLPSTADGGVLGEAAAGSLVCPLPIADASFFDFERELADWSASDDGTDNQREALDDRQDNAVRACKAQLVQQPLLGAYLREAMQLCQSGDFEDAGRCLLRAHYKTTLESPEEYFLVVWRVQVVLKLGGQSTTNVPHDAGLGRAVALLHEFLAERQRPDETQHDDDDEPASGSAQAKTKKPRARPSAANDDDDTDELSAQEMSWRQQRRVIRADAYAFLGQLQQLNGQEREARASFARALRLRDDHVVALLNFLQLSIVEAEYEAALDGIVRVFELVFGRTSVSDSSSSSNSSGATEPWSFARASDLRGILGASRALEVMLPGVMALRSDEEWSHAGSQMLQLLKEYKSLLSAHIQSSTSHIFRKQGALARLVEEIRQLQARRDADAAADLPLALDLDAFNRVVEEYTASVLREQTGIDTSTECSEASNQEELKATFIAELTQVCDQITRSLPPEALPSKRPPLVDADSAEITKLGGDEEVERARRRDPAFDRSVAQCSAAP